MIFFRLRIIRLLLLAGLLAVAAGCGPKEAGPESPPEEKKGPLSVKTVKPERKTLRRVFEQPGFIEAFEETPLFARVPGHVLKMHRDIGDPLKGPRYDKAGKETEPGQVLAELWVPEMVEELKQKQALVVQAKAAVEQAQAALDTAEANIETAKALVQEAVSTKARAQANYERWDSEYKRIDDLVKRNVIDKQTRDETLNQLKAADASRQEVEAKILSAQAGVRESEAKRNKARADLAAARAHVQVAQAEEGRAAAWLQYATIRAPYDGVVTRRTINTGSFVQPATGNGGIPLFVVARTDTVRIFAEVPEADALLVQKGVRVRIRVQTIKDRDFEGEVTRSAWSLDPKARTLRTEVDLPNPQGLLRPGMYAYATFTAVLPNRLTLPASAVTTQGEQTVCFLVKDKKAVRTPVRVGLHVGGLVEVLKKQGRAREGEEAAWEDFTGEEVIVRDNLSGLSDGQPVKVAQEK
jgi:HlyD family secretion protein